jgi:cation diffusion facilitator family transporter
MNMSNNTAFNEKTRVALLSVLAAVFLTLSKFIIGFLTGSLGILSEALHSCLDMVAAIITFVSVRISDRPADRDHHYGHGKVENFSALIETLLLLITCVWIIHEAVTRLVSGNTEIYVNIWSYIVVIVSIIIDFSRSRALMKTAVKHNNQALEADAVHFSTDIWSSSVVLLGLICANFGLHWADPVAALFVAAIVIYISFKLGKKAVDVLLDKATDEYDDIIEECRCTVPLITSVHEVKVRRAGADVFIDMIVHLDPCVSILEAHRMSDELEKNIMNRINRCTVHIHQEPEEVN